MVLPGIQALFGFQLVVVFSPGFSEKLTRPEQIVHFVAITLIAVAVALIMTPAALHRGTGSKKVTATFVNLSARLLFLSMLPLALGICMDFYLIARIIVDRSWGIDADSCALCDLYDFVVCTPTCACYAEGNEPHGSITL